MLIRTTQILLLMLALSGCSEGDPGAGSPKPPPWVKTVDLRVDGQSGLGLSGIVRARFETPVAFQVGGRILARHVDAGQRVKAGQRLFSLDPRDLDEAERAAAAQLAAATAALATASSELARQQQLVEKKFISRQALDRFELAERDALSQRDAARASLAQARNARTYSELHADRDGVLIEVDGESGQVVAAGQAVALLAQEEEREIEVYLPDGRDPPRGGYARLADGERIEVVLREMAGAADPLSRTWRARYRLLPSEVELPLGTVVQVVLTSEAAATGARIVPLGALDERSGGPRIWRIIDGRAEPVPVELLALDAEQAHITVDLPPETRIIALGTHLLTPGMAVRELGQ